MIQFDMNTYEAERMRVEDNDIFDFDLEVVPSMPGVVFPHMNFKKWSKENYEVFLNYWANMSNFLFESGYRMAAVLVADDAPKLAKFLPMVGFLATGHINTDDGRHYVLYTMELR